MFERAWNSLSGSSAEESEITTYSQVIYLPAAEGASGGASGGTSGAAADSSADSGNAGAGATP
jgi:hypothetical protein